MLFLIDPAAKTAEPIKTETLSGLQYRERFDLQEWVLSSPTLLGEELLVVTSEFNRFDRTSERLDALMLDRQGKLVVVELKRSAVGTAADLQALRYAAYCSTLLLDDVVELYAKFHGKSGRELTKDDARTELQDFISDPAFEELDNKPRIILAAEEFPPEMTATLLWLRTYEVDISAVRLRPHRISGQVILESSILIPLPEAEDFLIRRERKDVGQATRTRGRQEQYRVFFQELIDRLREDHQFTNARAGQPQNWYTFASGLPGIGYAAVFTREGLRAEVYIDLGDQEQNKRVFDALRTEADALQPQFDDPLAWERLDDRRASRIGIYHGTTIDASPEELEGALRWMIQTLMRLKEVFGQRLAELL